MRDADRQDEDYNQLYSCCTLAPLDKGAVLPSLWLGGWETSTLRFAKRSQLFKSKVWCVVSVFTNSPKGNRKRKKNGTSRSKGLEREHCYSQSASWKSNGASKTRELAGVTLLPTFRKFKDVFT